MAMALHCHLALLKTKENNGDMKKKYSNGSAITK